MGTVATIRSLDHAGLWRRVAMLSLTLGLAGCAAYGQCQRDACTHDQDITRAVQKVIRQYPALEAPNVVRVQTIDHVVYLHGQVNNEVERSTAQQAALSVSGVTRVVNDISMQYEGR